MDGNIIEFSNLTYNKFIGEYHNSNKNKEKNMLYLYIRFNTPLNAKTIHKKTTCLIDKDNNIFEASVSYNKFNHTIIIKPAKPYLENKPYYLIITRDIKSLTGKSLTENVKIKFEVAKDTVINYEIMKGKGAINPVIGGRKKTAEAVKETFIKKSTVIKKLPFSRQYFIGFIALVSIIIIVYSFIKEFHSFMYFGIILLTSAFIKMGRCFFNPKSRSLEMYNIGVKKFNATKYEDSITCFEDALLIDSKNELAQKAIDVAYEKLIESYLR